MNRMPKFLKNFVFILFFILASAQSGFCWTKELYAQFIKDAVLLSPPEIRVFFAVTDEMLNPYLDNLVLGDYDVNAQRAFVETIVTLREPKRDAKTVMGKLVELAWHVAEATKPALDRYRLALIAQRRECLCVLFDGYQKFTNLREVLTRAKGWLASSVGIVEEFYLFGEREFEQEASRSIEVLYNATVNLIVDAWYSAFVIAQMPVRPAQAEGAQIFPKDTKPPLQPVELQFRMSGFKKAIYGESEQTVSQDEISIAEVVKTRKSERPKEKKTKESTKKSSKESELVLTQEPEEFVSLDALITSAESSAAKPESKSVEAQTREVKQAQTEVKSSQPSQKEEMDQPAEEIVFEASVSAKEVIELVQKAKQAQGAVGAISPGESGEINIDALLSALEGRKEQTSGGRELKSKGVESKPKTEEIDLKLENLDTKRQTSLLEKTEIRVESPIRVPVANGSTQGELEFEQISQILNDNIGGIKFCYELGLRRNPALSGKVEVEFTIGEDGRVSAAEVKSSTLKDKHVEECILRKIRSLRFPKPVGGKITVKYPFVFEQSTYF